ncbi:hypothetical protein ACSBR2_025981 [Camellia fascicularis]
MAEKELKTGHPPATNSYARSDEEAQTAEAEKFRLKKRKRLTFFIIFMVSQIVIGIGIGLTIMKVKYPAGHLKTKKFNVVVNLITPPSLLSDTKLASDISFGLLPLSNQSKRSGKVKLILIMKKKKSTQMSCTMNVNIKTQQLQDVMCN